MRSFRVEIPGNKAKFLIASFLVLSHTISLCSLPHAATSEPLSQAFSQNMAALQKTKPGSPKERALQKTVIEIVRKMGTTPPMSEAVDRHMARAEAFAESGRSKESFQRAAREFRAITRIAPWIAQPYYNLGVMQEKAGKYDAAMESLRMYLFAAPTASDTRRVKRLIYKMEALKEEAKAQAAEQRRQDQARLQQDRRRREEQKQERRDREREKHLASLQRLHNTKWCMFGNCWGRMKMRADRFTLSYSRKQRVFGEMTRIRKIFKGQILPGGEINGTYVHRWITEGKCGNRPLTESYPFSGTLQDNGRKLFFEFTEDQVGWDFKKCKLVMHKRHARKVEFTFKRK